MAGKKEFSATEVMMLQEEMRKSIAVIGEQYGDIKNDTTELKQRVTRIEEDVAIIKASLPLKANKTELEALDQRVTVLETKVA